MAPAQSNNGKNKKGTRVEDDSEQRNQSRALSQPEVGTDASEKPEAIAGRGRNSTNKSYSSSRGTSKQPTSFDVAIRTSSRPGSRVLSSSTILDRGNGEVEAARIAAARAKRAYRRGRITLAECDAADAAYMEVLKNWSDDLTTLAREDLFKLPITTTAESRGLLEAKTAQQRPPIVVFVGGNSTNQTQVKGNSGKYANFSSRLAALNSTKPAYKWNDIEFPLPRGKPKAASAPPSSITTANASATSLTPGGRAAVRNQKRSQTPKSQFEGTHKKTPGGDTVWRGNAGYEYDELFEEDVLNWLARARNGEYEVLMLRECQGSTFGYGKKFQVEDGSWHNAADARSPETAQYKTKHISFFGDNIEQIGTKGCMTCLGVYFAIKGFRVFCAHFNVWYNERRQWRAGQAPIKEDTDRELYEQIRLASWIKMRDHAAEYGWKPADVDRDTIKFVSPYREHVAHIVARAILEFLIVDPKEFYEQNAIVCAQGFIITPGSDKWDVPRGKVFELKHKGQERYFPDLYKFRFMDIPAIFKQYRFVDDDLLPSGDWYYTAGKGNDNEWIFIPNITVERVRGKTVYFDEDYMKWLHQKGLAIAGAELAYGSPDGGHV